MDTEKLKALAAKIGITDRELSNAVFWLEHSANSPDAVRPDFRGGSVVVRDLLAAAVERMDQA